MYHNSIKKLLKRGLRRVEKENDCNGKNYKNLFTLLKYIIWLLVLVEVEQHIVLLEVNPN
jgi:hypothetical protein